MRSRCAAAGKGGWWRSSADAPGAPPLVSAESPWPRRATGALRATLAWPRPTGVRPGPHASPHAVRVTWPQRRGDRAQASDVVIGAGAAVVGLAATLATPVLSRAADLVGRGVGLVIRHVSDAAVSDLAERGAQVRAEVERLARELVGWMVPPVVDAAVAEMNLTQLVARHVDIDFLAALLDVDAVVARADLDAVIARVDIAAVLDRVDLNTIIDRLDLDAIVGSVDLDAVAAKIDLEAIVKRVDPDAVIARVDVDATLARLDLAAIARQVIDEIDLPEILRQSTGAVSSEAVREIRDESMLADEALARFVDRVLRRRRAASP